MSNFVVAHIDSFAETRGITRGIDADVGSLEVDNDDRNMQLAKPLLDIIANGNVQLMDHCDYQCHSSFRSQT